MDSETVKALIDAYGPMVVLLGVLVFLLRKPQASKDAIPSAGFDADEKLYLKEGVVEPILKAMKD